MVFEVGNTRVRKPLALLLLVILAWSGGSSVASPQPARSRENRALPAAAATDDVWAAPRNLSETAGRSTSPVLAQVGPDGDLWAVWTEIEGGTGDNDEIMGRRLSGTTGEWGDPLNLSANPGREAGPALYADRQGRGHLAWTRWGGPKTELVYRQWVDGAWGSTQVLRNTDANPFPYNLLFVEDISGTLWLFVNLGSGVCHARLGAEGWEWSDWVYLNGLKGLVDIAPGSDGLFHVALYGSNACAPCGPTDGYLSDPYYATTDGLHWSPFLNIGGTGTVVYDVELEWDTAGALHMVWSDNHPLGSYDSARSAVYERVLQGGAWGARTEVSVPNTEQAVEDLALLADGAGPVHLLWSEGVLSGTRALDLSIRYRRWTAAGWGEEELVYTSTLDSINVGMAIDRWGEPAAAWEEGSTDAEEVYFSRRRGVRPYRAYLPLVERWAGR